MADSYQIVFVKAGDGSPASKKTVAEKIAAASKVPTAKLVEQIESAPFIYKRGLPRAKADAISATLNKLGAITQVAPDGAPLPSGSGEFEIETPSGEFAVGSPAPAASAPASPGGFDFAPPPASGAGGFDFGGPAASSSSPFGAPSGSSGGGFSFSPEAAVSSPTHASADAPVHVERNLDYAAGTGEHAAPGAAPPPKQPRGKGKEPETVTCPRCGHEVPKAPECASCGVLLAKAGEEAAGHRRPRAVKVQKKSLAKPILVGVLVVVLGLVGAFVAGVFNPLRLQIDSKASGMLRDFGVQLSPPAGPVLVAEVTDGDKAKDIEEAFVGRSRRIDQELARLGALDDVAQFDAGVTALQGEIDPYLAHPAHALMAEARKVAAAYYPVQGVGLRVGGKSYMMAEAAELIGDREGIEVVLSDIEIRRRLDVGRDEVAQREQVRLAGQRTSEANKDLSDSFDGPALAEHWTVTAPEAFQFNQGWLFVTGRSVPLGQAPKLLALEPEADYTVDVTISGTSKAGTRAGLLVFESESMYAALTRTSGRRGQVVQVLTHGGPGDDAPGDGTITLRIDRTRQEYAFSFWDGRKWVSVDKFRPFEDPRPRWLGIVVFGGGDGFYFDNYTLQVKR